MLEGMTHFKHEAVDRTGSPRKMPSSRLSNSEKTTPPSGTFTTKVPSCGTTSLLCWVR